VGLTDDQRAMLRLLAERGEEGYEDIAALKGVSVERVRAEMKAALAAAAAEQEPAAPEEVPKAPEPAPEEPKPAPATPPAPAPSASGPAAQLPAPKPARPRSRPRPGAAIAPERRRFVLIAAAALGLVAVLLVLIAVIGGTSGGSSSSGAEASTAAGAEGGASAKLTQAELRPVSGQSGEGQAIFGRVGKEEIVLQVAAQELEPNKPGQSYTVWLYRNPKVSLRVGSAKVTKSGRLGVQLPIPSELLAYVAAGAFKQIYLSRTDDTAFEREVARAKKEKTLPAYSGETVLTGEITGPIVKKAG
jgi:hypothetical protein